MSMYAPRRRADDLRPAPRAAAAGRCAGRRRPVPRRRVRAGILPAGQRARRRRQDAARPRRAGRPRKRARPRSIRSITCTACCRCSPTSTPGPRRPGIKAETLISEYAPGQYELTLHYRNDVMQAADDLMRLKRHRAGAGARAWRDRLLHGQAERGLCRLRHAFPRLDAGRARAGTSSSRRSRASGTPPSCTRSAACARRWANRCWSLRRTPIPGAASPAQSYAPVSPDLGRQQPLGRAAHPGRRHQGPPDRAPPRRRGRQPLSGRRHRAGRHPPRA